MALLPTDQYRKLLKVIDQAWSEGFTVQSYFARANAELVAMAASLALITTRVTATTFSRKWQVTSKGLRWLNESKMESK